MRIGLLVAGIIVLLAGLWATFGHGTYRDTDTLAQIGPAKIEATHSREIPQWLGIGGIVIGGILIVGGIVRKRG